MAKLTEKINNLKARLKELEAEQKAQTRAARSAESARARKAEARKKFEAGGLLKIATLLETDRGALLGALLTLPPLLADHVSFTDFKRIGDALLARREQERINDKTPSASASESYLQ